MLFAIQSGLLSKWAEAFPDPRQEPEIDMAVILASHLAARFTGLYSIRKSGYAPEPSQLFPDDETEDPLLH